MDAFTNAVRNGSKSSELFTMLCNYLDIVILLITRFVSPRTCIAGHMFLAALRFQILVLPELGLPSRATFLESIEPAPTSIAKKEICIFCQDHPNGLPHPYLNPCRADFDKGPVLLPCKHMFCKACLEKMLTQSSSCPICRHQLVISDRLSVTLDSLILTRNFFWRRCQHLNIILVAFWFFLWLLKFDGPLGCCVVAVLTAVVRGNYPLKAGLLVVGDSDMHEWRNAELWSIYTLGVVTDFMWSGLLLYVSQDFFVAAVLTMCFMH